jgi:ATP-dependent exoDNAse (exonuclease V) alpha subunit
VVEPKNRDGRRRRKTIVVHPTAVPQTAIDLGWAVTVDKYQGAQCDTFILSITEKDAQTFSREHGNVALTRAEQRFIMCGSLNCLSILSCKQANRRRTDLKDELLLTIKGHNM